MVRARRASFAFTRAEAAGLPLRYTREIMSIPGARSVMWLNCLPVSCNATTLVTLNGHGGPGAACEVRSMVGTAFTPALERACNADPMGILLGATAQDESAGTLTPAVAQLVGTLPGVAHGKGGHPMVAPKFVTDIEMMRGDGQQTTVLVRGVTPMFWQVAGHAFDLTVGHFPRAGVDQVLTGSGAVAVLKRPIKPGTSLYMRNSAWPVTGGFDAHGSLWDS